MLNACLTCLTFSSWGRDCHDLGQNWHHSDVRIGTIRTSELAPFGRSNWHHSDVRIGTKLAPRTNLMINWHESYEIQVFQWVLMILQGSGIDFQNQTHTKTIKNDISDRMLYFSILSRRKSGPRLPRNAPRRPQMAWEALITS